jgi:hypothetical protein
VLADFSKGQEHIKRLKKHIKRFGTRGFFEGKAHIKRLKKHIKRFGTRGFFEGKAHIKRFGTRKRFIQWTRSDA